MKRNLYILVLLSLVCLSSLIFAASFHDNIEHINSNLKLKSKVNDGFLKLFDVLPKSREDANQIAKGIQENSFKQFLKVFNKNYTNFVEYKRRFDLFKESVKRVLLSKFDYAIRKISYIKGINQFSDWDDEEFSTINGIDEHEVEELKKILIQNSQDGGRIKLSQDVKTKQNVKFNHDINIYGGIDWSASDCVLRPESQGSCGSCYSFAMTSMVETNRCIQDGGLVMNMSKQYLVDCHGTSHQGCHGSNYLRVSVHLMKKNIMARAECYPYIGRRSICLADILKDKPNCLVTPRKDGRKLEFVVQSGQTAMMDVLKSGPFSGVIWIPRSFKEYSKGIYDSSEPKSPGDGFHAVLIVGYGYFDAQGYWIIKNSWGEWWGERGYARVAMGRDVLGIEKSSFSIINE